jgi:hypothetical protein
MPASQEEIKRRELASRAAIKRSFETEDEEEGAGLFVSHHLAELDAAYWRRHTSKERPEAKAVLDLLQLRSHWGGDDEIEAFDFSLPEDVTQYVICVRFDERGEISEIAMES